MSHFAIGVGTDFSEQAERASRAAVALAKKLGASITLIHAVEPHPTEAQDADLADEARRRVAPLVDSVRASGVLVDLAIVHGYAEEALASAAKRIGARLLVIGTHGRRAPLRWLLGSVAERTLQSSELPVLVVGDDGGALTAWANGEHPLRITLALESVTPPQPMVEVARLFHRAGACSLNFVHVVPRGLLAGRLPMLLERAFGDQLAEFGASLQILPDGESLADAIAAFVSGHPCDMTVVGIHPRRELEVLRTAELARSLLHRRIGPVMGIPLPPPIALTGETPTFGSILAPTDLSDRGNRAIPYAYAISRGGSVTLLHVLPTPDVPLDAEQRAGLELQLLALVPADAYARGTSTNVLIVEADEPAQAIVDTATRLGCNIICMGSHGRSALGRAVLGSVAEVVLHRFPKAVLIVR